MAGHVVFGTIGFLAHMVMALFAQKIFPILGLKQLKQHTFPSTFFRWVGVLLPGFA
jgi:hypothetical protein